jgi:hypothetical protein
MKAERRIQRSQADFSVIYSVKRFQLLSWRRVYVSRHTPTQNERSFWEMGLDFYQYKGVFSQIDTTLELTNNHPSQSWTIYSTFFFDLQGRC